MPPERGESNSPSAGQEKRAVGLAFAVGLAALAGWVDAVAYLHLNGLYVSFMSGNSTAFAVSLSGSTRIPMIALATVLIGFAAGVFGGELIGHFGGRRGQPLLFLAEAGLLFAGAGGVAYDTTSWLSAIPLTVALGMQNGMIYLVGGTGVATTYVTGTLVRAARGAAHAVLRLESWRAPLPYVALWLGLVCGAAGGAVIGRHSTIVALVMAGIAALYFASRTAFSDWHDVRPHGRA
ncbi:MAG TPA: YoaK family protein [Rhizomicrobium sp.]|jgi:uncharacterized membrane protein YoaK (UPF0700 family)|nr:YoaK family protein [Rhizomicrobium sp.]